MNFVVRFSTGALLPRRDRLARHVRQGLRRDATRRCNRARSHARRSRASSPRSSATTSRSSRTSANVGWDVGFNSELARSIRCARWRASCRALGTRAPARRRADRLVELPTPTRRTRLGAPARRPRSRRWSLTTSGSTSRVNGTWRNLLDGADRLKVAYDALRTAAPHASRVIWLGADHSSAVTTKMAHRPYRIAHRRSGPASSTVRRDLRGGEHAVRARLRRSRHSRPSAPPCRASCRSARTRSSCGARSSRSSGSTSTSHGSARSSRRVFPDPLAPPDLGRSHPRLGRHDAALRASLGRHSYALFTPRLAQTPAWKLTAAEQLMLIGGPTRLGGVMQRGALRRLRRSVRARQPRGPRARGHDPHAT